MPTKRQIVWRVTTSPNRIDNRFTDYLLGREPMAILMNLSEGIRVMAGSNEWICQTVDEAHNLIGQYIQNKVNRMDDGQGRIEVRMPACPLIDPSVTHTPFHGGAERIEKRRADNEKRKRMEFIADSDNRVAHWSQAKREAFRKAVSRLHGQPLSKSNPFLASPDARQRMLEYSDKNERSIDLKDEEETG